MHQITTQYTFHILSINELNLTPTINNTITDPSCQQAHRENTFYCEGAEHTGGKRCFHPNGSVPYQTHGLSG
jgi:hypothetical protein